MIDRLIGLGLLLLFLGCLLFGALNADAPVRSAGRQVQPVDGVIDLTREGTGVKGNDGEELTVADR